MDQSTASPPTRRVLGIEFFHGTVEEAVAFASHNGGLVVAPAGLALVKLRYDEGYRRAVVEADLAIADSGCAGSVLGMKRSDEYKRPEEKIARLFFSGSLAGPRSVPSEIECWTLAVGC